MQSRAATIVALAVAFCGTAGMLAAHASAAVCTSTQGTCSIRSFQATPFEATVKVHKTSPFTGSFSVTVSHPGVPNHNLVIDTNTSEVDCEASCGSGGASCNASGDKAECGGGGGTITCGSYLVLTNTWYIDEIEC